MKKLILAVFVVIFSLSLTACAMRDNEKVTDNNQIGNESIVSQQSNASSNNDEVIGRDKAKEIALKHAGLEEKDVFDLEIDHDLEMGKNIYEVTFDSNGFEYDYDIDATSGEIIFSEKDPE